MLFRKLLGVAGSLMFCSWVLISAPVLAEETAVTKSSVLSNPLLPNAVKGSALSEEEMKAVRGAGYYGDLYGYYAYYYTNLSQTYFYSGYSTYAGTGNNQFNYYYLGAYYAAYGSLYGAIALYYNHYNL